MTQDRRDDVTNRQLELSIGLVVVCAAIPIIWSVARTIELGSLGSEALVFGLLIVGANAVVTTLRVGATNHGMTSTCAAVLVAIAFAPPESVVLCTVLAIGLSNAFLRRAPVKAIFNVAKNTLAAGAAAVASHLVGFVPGQLTAHDGGLGYAQLAGVLTAFVAYSVIDELVPPLVLAIASGIPASRLLRTHWDIRLVDRLGNLAVVLLALAAHAVEPWLLAVMPPMLYAMHFASANRFRGRAESEAWQRLAQATDELNVVELDAVLRTAVRRAASLFSADEIEVEVRIAGEPPRVIRGDEAGISYDGPAGEAPDVERYVIPFRLQSYSGTADIGELRLRFRGPVRLSERERYTLTTFAAALCTAAHNAATFAATQRLAESHARAAAQDPLTGLANRRRLQEYGAQILGESPARGVTALLLIDLNHFKEVNDTLGHSAGDRVLVEVGHRLAGAVADGDLVARLGGDEFAVLFVGLTAPAVAEARAQTVLGALSAPMDLDGMRISIEASGGVATAPSSGGVAELLRRADVAMYHAKRDGQRIARYAKSRDTADIAALTLGGDLIRAIKERQFTVLFQPIVDLGTGETIAAEALARWQHPERGELTPDRFLDSIERSDQLGAFADVVLDQALTAAGEWADAGFPIGVAVNVSPRSLLDPAFPDRVAAALTRHQIPPDALIVELTESVTLSQLEVVDDALGSLRELGVRLALDDFGTGFSSLSTIARVPVYELKIDRSFVSAMDTSAAGAVVRSTIELGRSLDLLVVAEGIERADQRNHLWELGCPAGQGHLFARPMPAPKLLAALREGVDGRPGVLARPLYEAGSVIRLPSGRRLRGGPHRLAE